MRIFMITVGLFITTNCSAQLIETNVIKIIRERINVNYNDTSLGKYVHFKTAGSIWIPNGYLNKYVGATDSEMGRLESFSLNINYDIGWVGGKPWPVKNENMSAYGHFIYDTLIDKSQIRIGIQSDTTEKEKLKIIVFGDYSKEYGSIFPVFFADVKNEKDIKEMLSIVFSYRPNTSMETEKNSKD